VSNSTLSGNSAGIYGGGIANNGTLTVSNSTLSGNSATELGGGGIVNFGGTVTVSNSIVAGNTAPSGAEISSTNTTINSGGYNLFGVNGNNGLLNVTTVSTDVLPEVGVLITGTQAEVINNLRLLAGTYFIEVKLVEDISTNYNLSFRA
jgi:hypothetical protein